ncbi:protein of unknown function [Pseudomonas asturiensis]|uniref:Uncharacterized protein n=2 Tax=Pseudomonas asturiensis TaxID=1190415 RepID=A0A1M7Q7A8_9PSED|nr:protein of unknown function [Pseudomonas asturiensis]
MATTTAQIQQLYVAYLGRAADKAGLDYWSTELNATPATLTLEDLRANFVNSQPEYAAIYGGLTREDTVAKIYSNLFGRAADADGLAYWTTGGGASVSTDLLLTAFINGASAADSQTVTNKVLVSEVYTNAAGTNFLAADAASIISGVTTNASISTALDKLTDGSLSGIAVPAGISALKADIAADAAVTAFETNNVATLKALSAELATLSTTGDKAGVIGDTTASTATTYAAQATALEAAITTARDNGTLNTETLTTKLTADTKTLATARTDYLTSDTTAVDKINAYDAAVKAVAANQGAAQGDIDQANGTFAAYVSNSANSAAYTKALSDAGLASTTTAADIYTTLSAAGTTDATISKITTAFASISEFSAVKTVAALEHSEAVAAASLSTAGTALTGSGATWKTAYDAVTEDNTLLTASKAVDALEAKYTVTDTAHDSLVSTATSTQTAVDNNATLLPVAANAGTANADVFHFTSAIAQTNDVAINFAAKDSLFLGEGYTLNSTATVDATTGFITGGNNNALEVFFVKDTVSGNVQAIVETSVTGSTTAVLGATVAGSATDGAAVITLTGVTDVSQVSFANGVISHVA